jgi:hypothetical protein
MTIRTLSFRTSLLLAGAALTTSMAFAESKRFDDILGNQAQSSPFQDFQAPSAPDALGAPVQPERRSAGPTLISGIMPESGPVGSQVTINGTNLGKVTHVLFGGSRDAPFKVINDSEVKATVPEGALPGLIELATPAGSAKSPVSFEVAN